MTSASLHSDSWLRSTALRPITVND